MMAKAPATRRMRITVEFDTARYSPMWGSAVADACEEVVIGTGRAEGEVVTRIEEVRPAKPATARRAPAPPEAVERCGASGNCGVDVCARAQGHAGGHRGTDGTKWPRSAL